MSTYLVSIPDDTDWREDPEDFAAAVKARWPDAEIKQTPPESTMVLSLKFVEHGELVLGRLHRDGQALSIDADVPAAAVIATWWRQRVPDDVSLLLFDEGYEADVPVQSGEDAETLASAYLAAANA